MAQIRFSSSLGVKLEPEIVVEMERIAEKRGMSKSEVARMLLKAGLEMHRDLEKRGVRLL